MPVTIAIIGAGSVVFTRDLLGDVLLVPRALRRPRRAARHRRRAAGHGGGDRPGDRARGRGPPADLGQAERRAALDGADYVINVIQVGMHEATVRDFEIPARFGLNQTIADTIGIGGIFRGLRTFPVLAEHRRGHGGGLPGRLVAELHQPDGHERDLPARRGPAAEGARAVPLGALDHARPVRAGRRTPRRGVLLVGRREPPGRGCCAGSAAAQDLYPLLDERIAADPELRRRVRVDMYRRLGYYPTETSEHSSEYVPWYLHHPSEVERLRLNVGEYVEISAENLAEYHRVRDQLARSQRLEVRSEATEYAPQVIHSLETGTVRVISANVANLDLISNLPDGFAVEVPTVLDALGAHPIARR